MAPGVTETEASGTGMAHTVLVSRECCQVARGTSSSRPDWGSESG